MTPGVVVAVLAAGVVGALSRYSISLALARHSRFPFAVLIVNVVGSIIGGALLGLFDRAAISAEWHLILLTGLAGGLTTFSTWSVETLQLIEAGRWRTAVSSVLANLVLGLAAASVAYLLARG
ncbi:N/A [soil metagenome]